MSALSWPFGFPARFAELGGAQTRFAQTMPALFPNSAALLDYAKGQIYLVFYFLHKFFKGT